MKTHGILLRRKHSEQGSILLEGLIAILIFSFGILGLIGLQATSMKTTTQAKERIDASLVANQRLANIWLDRTNLSTYAESNVAITDLPNGKRTTIVDVATRQVTVTITWRMPGQSSDNTFSTTAQIKGSGDA